MFGHQHGGSKVVGLASQQFHISSASSMFKPLVGPESAIAAVRVVEGEPVLVEGRQDGLESLVVEGVVEATVTRLLGVPNGGPHSVDGEVFVALMLAGLWTGGTGARRPDEGQLDVVELVVAFTTVAIRLPPIVAWVAIRPLQASRWRSSNLGLGLGANEDQAD